MTPIPGEKQPSGEFSTQEHIGVLTMFFCSEAAAETR
jgi:hypothetical protein